MSRYFDTQQTAPQPTLEGDQKFTGLNMKLDRSILQPGEVARSENKRLAKGVAEDRPGTISPKFANIVSYASILGSVEYSNPNGLVVMLLAVPTGVVSLRSGSYPTTIPIPEGVTLSGEITFSQQFDKVLLHRADGLPLEWDGLDLTGGFKEILKPDPLNTAVDLMPTDTPWSINFADRALFPIGLDELGASSINAPQVYDPLLNRYRINSGSSDFIVGAYPYAKNNVLIGKRHSFDVLVNFVGDLSQASMEILNSEIGIIARRTGQMVGADLWFLSDHGVYRSGEIIQDRIQMEPVPVSDKIKPLIDRINPLASHLSVAAVFDIYYFLAVPLDDAAAPNAILVCNTVTSEWESLDLWAPAAGMQIDNLFVSDYYGQRKLYAINHALKAVHLLYEGKLDEFPSGVYQQHAILETRGYATLGWNAATRRDVRRFEGSVSTWHPSTTVTLLTDRAFDERQLTPTPITRDNRKYFNSLLGRPDNTTDNQNGSHNLPGRLDYSVNVDTTVYRDVPFDPEKEQKHPLRISCKARGRWVSFRIENTQGSCAIEGDLVESVGSQHEPRRA